MSDKKGREKDEETAQKTQETPTPPPLAHKKLSPYARGEPPVGKTTSNQTHATQGKVYKAPNTLLVIASTLFYVSVQTITLHIGGRKMVKEHYTP